MSANSNNQGRAYEFAWMIVLEEKLSSIRPVKVIYNSSYEANEKAWNKMMKTAQNDYLISAKAAIDAIIELEPLLEEDDGVELTLEFQKDGKGETGDVRDIVVKRQNIEWEIGLSIKHNHEAVKHSRLSPTIDFGKEWFGVPCGDTYWEETKPIFDFLVDGKKKNIKWCELSNKEVEVYVPILNAFMSEVKRAYATDNDLPRKMIEYLIGIKDYHKVISNDSKRLTLIRTFNMHDTLNKPSRVRISAVTVPVVALPTRIIALDFKPSSQTTVEMYLDNGWELSFRIHNAEKVLTPSLKFDIQFMGMPTTILTFSCVWH